MPTISDILFWNPLGACPVCFPAPGFDSSASKKVNGRKRGTLDHILECVDHAATGITPVPLPASELRS